jgi:hypothetical protein
MAGIKKVVGLSMDSSRVHCDQGAIADFCDELEGVIDGIPSEFVYNVDKPAEMIVLVLVEFEEDRIFVPIDRYSQRSTMVVCIACDGSAMKTLIIADRFPMEDDLQLYGPDLRKVFMVSQSRAFMTTALLEKWADEVFFPTVEHIRVQNGYQGPALVILDGFSSHHSSGVPCRMRAPEHLCARLGPS